MIDRLKVTSKILSGTVLLAASAPLFSVSSQAAEPAKTFPADQIEFFEKHVRPVLADNCYDCHGGHRHENGLRVDNYAGILRGSDYGVVATPGNTASSKLLKAIKHQDGAPAMPKKGNKLSDGDIANIEKWIAMGMPWPAERDPVAHAEKPKWESHWAFKKIEPPAIPVTKTPVANPLDAFVAAKQAEAGLDFAPAADRATLGRRLYLTITGLLPSYDELQKFVNDPAPDAPAKLIDQLLNSPQYGVRWARHWLDIARYSDTEGYRAGGVDIRYPHAYTYRDWVVKALNDDLPYNQFVVQQLAADHLVEPGKTDASLAALGFLTVNDSFQGDNVLQIDDRIDVVSRGILGLTVSCARCHDHKYDPIPTKDYYAFFSIFSSSEVPTQLPIIGYPQDQAAVAAYNASVNEVEKEKLKMREDVYAEIRKTDRLRDYLAFVRKAASFPDEQFRGEAGKAQLRDRIAKGFVELFQRHTTDKPHPVLLAWKKFAELPEDQFAAKAPAIAAELARPDSAANAVVRNELAKRPAPKSFTDVAQLYSDIFVTCMNGSQPDNADWQAVRAVLMDTKSPMSVKVDEIQRFFTQRDRLEMVKLENKINKLDIESPGAPQRAMVMQDRPQPRDERIMIRGNPGRRGDPAPRGYLTMFGGTKFTQGSGRLELAQALVDRENPLTARVIVNRVWAQHFGKPLVSQTSDFGVETPEPVQLALLDHLAANFMENGWSLKKLHRQILNSRTWQQSAESNANKDLKDPENQLLTRQNRRRLDYEAMRDTMLQVSEALAPSYMGGRAVPYQDPNVNTRRSVYLFVDRFQQETVPAVFDFANPDAHSPVRSDTTVPQQTLFLMNSPFARDQADLIAQKTPVQGSHVDSESLKHLYHRVLLREPTPNEVEIASTFIHDATDLQTGTPYTWEYGFAEVTPASVGSPATIGDFTAFKNFRHTKEDGTRWRVSDTYPDKDHGYLVSQRVGNNQIAGHTGRGNTANVVRWVAPMDTTIRIIAPFKHSTKRGDGIQAWIFHNRTGILAEKHLQPDQGHEFRLDHLQVKAGDILTFAAGRGGNEDSDSYLWTPRIEIQDTPGGPFTLWTDAGRDFLSPGKWPINLPRPQTPLSQLAHVLIISNEFQFVD
jgi:cytochrome c553